LWRLVPGLLGTAALILAVLIAANGTGVAIYAFHDHPDSKPSTYLIFAALSWVLALALGFAAYGLLRVALKGRRRD
jgi:hypothetical protein